MESKIFKDNTFNKDFNQNGYIIFDHHQADISDRLTQVFSKYTAENTSSGFNTTHFSNNLSYKKEVLQLAKDIFKESFSELFLQHEVFFANLMIKPPQSNDLLPVHADWAYIDESQNSVISLWIPAVDITDDNGALGVIPSSSHLYEKVRGPEIVSSYRKFDKTLKEEKGVLLPISKKQAVIYDLKLLHYSLPNFTNTPRIAINITLKPKNADLIHYSKQGDVIHKYNDLNEEFFLNYHAHQVPEEKVPCKIIPITPQISDDQIIEFYQLPKKDIPPSLWEKITHIFKY